MTDGIPEKPSRKVAPQERKARDNARQRKIASNSSDKASRRNAPLIKALANRKLRRQLDAELQYDPLAVTETAARRALVKRDRHWGSRNAAEGRAIMAEERAWLDANPPSGPRGRGRRGLDELRRRLGLPEGNTKQQVMQRLLFPDAEEGGQ